MLEARIVKVIMVGCLALFALLVTFDNLIDYDTNYAFVRHVLSMDTTFPSNTLRYRRITSPALWQAGYALIIAGEGLTGAVLAVAAAVLVVRRNHRIPYWGGACDKERCARGSISR
jgi:predicted small integral membrane protein